MFDTDFNSNGKLFCATCPDRGKFRMTDKNWSFDVLNVGSSLLLGAKPCMRICLSSCYFSSNNQYRLSIQPTLKVHFFEAVIMRVSLCKIKTLSNQSKARFLSCMFFRQFFWSKMGQLTVLTSKLVKPNYFEETKYRHHKVPWLVHWSQAITTVQSIQLQRAATPEKVHR